MLQLVLVALIGTASAATPPQLHPESFAACLREAAASPDLSEIRSRHRFGALDQLLTYLAVYPDVRPPAPFDGPQERARRRWAVAFEALEKELAWAILGLARTSPSEVLSIATERCGDVFCGALVAHNVLRTLGRHQRGGRFNPSWFESDRDFWLAQIEPIRAKLFSLRADGGGDGYGEWYHFFGLLSYGVRDASLNGGFMRSEVVARLNELLNPVLAGGREDPAKARLDRDSVDVAREYLGQGAVRAVAPCSEREAYVRWERVLSPRGD